MCSLWEINRGKKRLKSFLITCREKRSSSAECNVFEDGAIYKWKESVFFIRTASCGPVWDTASPGSNSWQGERVQLLISLISTLNHRGTANQWNHWVVIGLYATVPTLSSPRALQNEISSEKRSEDLLCSHQNWYVPNWVRHSYTVLKSYSDTFSFGLWSKCRCVASAWGGSRL